MKHLLSVCALLLCFGCAAVARPVMRDPFAPPQNWHATLSADDQGDFDKYYAKWMEAKAKNDREDITENTRKMQEIMTRNSIPADVSFDQVASASAYPNPAYAAPVSWHGRLSTEDQKDFDKYYAKWVAANRKNSQEDISENARKMQDIMARNGIASDVAFAQIASGAEAYPNGPAASYVQTQRLSSDDQRDFDHAYKEWLEARHKKHQHDMDKHAQKMQDIMARYNIPANVSYDRIASPGASYR
jgi:Skp family chaperone for outer membrane proteins